MEDSVNLSKLDIKYLSMLSEDGTLKYSFMMSLENIVMANIASGLWMNKNTQQDIKDFKKLRKFRNWHDIENRIFSKVSQLFLPNYIAEKLMYTITSLGKSLLEWIWYFNENILMPKEYESEYSAVDLINNITWTARGRIDCSKTAKNILANQDICLSDDHKYKLACNHCLEDEIAVLTPKVASPLYIYKLNINFHPMVFFWITHIKNDITTLNHLRDYKDINQRLRDMNINELVIQLLIKSNHKMNDASIKFIWNKLSGKEKAKYIKSVVEIVKNQDFICSLLSNLDYDVQQNIFKECIHLVLYNILDDWWWWWGECFLPTVLHTLDIMDPRRYCQLLSDINIKKQLSYEKKGKYIHDQYKSLFKQLWLEGPMQLKDYIIQFGGGRDLANLVRRLSWKTDMDVIEIIMNDLNTQQKKSIIFGSYGTHNYIILDRIILILITFEIFFMIY